MVPPQELSHGADKAASNGAVSRSPAAEISTGTVRLFSEYTGRGPTKARTYLNNDLVTVVMQDTMTKGERSLVAHGRAEVVCSMRREYQQTLESELIKLVEHATSRKVVAFMSGNHLDPDMAAEVFVLEPVPSEQ